MEVYPGNFAPFTPENLVSNVFLGDGVEVVGVSFSGDPTSVGYFQNAQADIGIDRGIILSSGLATDAPGIGCPPGICNNTGNNGVASTSMGNGGDPDLQISSGFNINDAVVYEIDFIPVADTLQFNYVFASEEYQSYTCSNFNDAFGFYISGPGINGGFTNNAENIALVPGTNLPVTINTVNSGVPTGGPAANCVSLAYSNFFVDNIGNPEGLSVEYSGFTTVFTATAIVQPCQQYKIKLACGDAFDDILDSAVFLEAKSFGTGSIQVEATTVSIDGVISEGCTDAVLSFTLPNPAENDIPLNYTIQGTAQNGVDYTFIPDNLMIPAGSDSIGFVINGIEDNIVEGLETFELIVQTDICFFDTITLSITENQLSPPMMEDTTICDGGTAQLDATIDNLFVPPPIPFSNTNSEIIGPGTPYEFPIDVSGLPYDILEPNVISSICINIVNTAAIFEAQVFLTTPGGQFLELTTQNGAGFVPGGGYVNTCFTETATTPINFNPSGETFAPASAVPFTGNWLPEGPWTDIYGGPANGTYTLIVYDLAPGFAPTFQDWTIEFNAPYFLTYNWSEPATLTCNDCPDPEAFPSASTTYTVTITDTYGCSVTGSVDVDVVNQLPTPNVSCGTFTSTSVTVEWDAVSGAVGYEVSVDSGPFMPVNPGDLFYEESGLSVGQSVTFEVVAVSADCLNSNPASISCTAQPCLLTTSLDGSTNVSCSGEADGTATLSASGSGTITYDIGGGNTNTTGLFTNLAAGDYTVSITDDDCTLTENVTITEPDALTITNTFSNVSCNGQADGTITVTVGGGSPTYNYAWSGGLADTDDTVDNLSGGDYTVTVTDDNGCTITLSQTINENPALTISSTTTDATCNGLADGSATVTVGGGSGTYDYLWDTNAADQMTATATGLDVGNYVVTVTDSDACTITTSVTIDAPASMTTTTSATMASCSGSTDGTATVVASGGAGGYNYEWGDGQMTDLAINLSDGWHYVTVTDANGCMAIDSAEVTVPNPINLTLTGNDISCNGGTDGDASVVASGGAGGFSYEWSNAGEVTDNISAVGAGIYTVTVTDLNGCSSTDEITLNEPTALTITLDSTHVDCFGESTGGVTATVMEGTPPYTYSWTGGANTDVVTGLAAGTYTVTVTDDNLCTITASIDVTESPELTSSMSVGGASCSGGGDGSATVTPNGGTGPFTYEWSDGQLTATATGLMAQTYTVTVTDDLGCMTTNSINVAEPPAISVAASGTNISCFAGSDGTVSAIGNGGDGNYTFSWSIPATGDTQTGLVAGTYTVTVSDGNGCTATDDVIISEPTEIIVTEVITDVSCGGGSDGSVNITVSGGSPAYAFAWSDGSTGEDCINVPAGDYTVTVTDANGCEFSNTYTIGEPTPVVVSLTETNVFCFNGSDGSIDATISGGTTPYSFAWSSSETTEDLNNIPAGDYTITVTDGNNCTATAATTVTQPASGVTVSMSPDATVCFGTTTASATATASGGAVGYTYIWSNNETSATINNLGAGTYTVTVSDMNNCTTTGSVTVNELADISSVLSANSASCNNGSDGSATVTAISGGAGVAITDYTITWGTTPPQTGTTASNLTAGQTYDVTITDANGCTGTNSVTIPNPTSVVVNLLNTVPVSCSGESDGSITVSGSGGTAPYTYAWSNGQVTDMTENLTLGTYTVTVSDANGCTATDNYSVENPAMLDVTIQGSDASCPGWSNGIATAYPTGGVPPYSFEWSNGDLTEEIDSLPSGNYNVTVTDANNCMIAASVYIGEPTWLNQDIIVTDVTCFGDRDGSIIVTATGGTPPYMYSFDSGMSFSNTDAQVGLFPGDYGVVVQDANGCQTFVDTVTVGEPLPVEVTIFPDTTVVTYELTDSIELSVDVMNGVGALTYSWEALYGDQDMSCTDCPNPVITGYENNRFEVTVTDANGCVGTDEIEVIVSRNREVYVPTGFTPNNDGVNDYLMVHGTSGTRVITFRVYDRWGELVFRADRYNINSENSMNVWDGTFKGKPMNPAVFVWYLEVKHIDGREESFEGNTTLLR